MTPYTTIIHQLESGGIPYELSEHEPVRTSEEAAKVRGDITLHQGAKALVLQADNDFILFVVPGDMRADLDKLKKYLGVKKLNMAKRESVHAKTELEVGSIPPFGSAIGLKTYLDPRLGDNAKIAFNPGVHDKSIVMKYEDYLKLENPQIVPF